MKLNILEKNKENNEVDINKIKFKDKNAKPEKIYYCRFEDAINLIGMAIENIREKQFKPYFGTDFDGFTVLDVRSRASYEEKHIDGAINIPAGQLRDRMAEIPRDKPILVHCYRGYSSYVVVRILMQNGFKDVFSYAGGWQQYEAETM